jgi:Zn-dependent peptidase ImmA (M78 family)
MILQHIEELTEKILKEANCFTVPVNVKKCVIENGIKLQEVELEGEVSGFFVIKEKTPHIGINKFDPEKRKRFTMAHEFGHYVLHSKDIPLFVDKTEKALYRNVESSTGEIIREREANSFAAALLMPKRLLKREIENCEIDFIESITDFLAKKFHVSEKAMAYRLTNLGLLDFGLF